MQEWLVIWGEEIAEVPVAVLDGLRKSLTEVAAAIAALPAGGIARRSLRAGKMHLDFSGWRFFYVVQPEQYEVRVVDARRRRA